MVVVDSSVWIDFFGEAPGTPGPLLELLRRGEIRVVVPDLVLFEVLRGFRTERALRGALQLMNSLSVEAAGGANIAMAAADHYRVLRAHGITVRSAIDVLVATFCIEHDYALLHRDRDFDGFERLRGLRVWPARASSRDH